MMKRFFFFLKILIVSNMAFGQVYGDSELIGTKYLEDQFYAGLGYNIIINEPDIVVQRNLSYHLQLGFIKDLPLNQRRNVAIGLGLGYATNSYYSNIQATEKGDDISYSVADSDGFRRSKLETHLVELPLELRWRTSTDINHRFWRIYAGFKLGYVFSGRSKFVSEDGDASFANDDIEKFRYGPMINFGYNTFNIHIYYSLNNVLQENTLLEDGTPFDFKVLRVGVMFYIL